jgi:hypothetical protein
MADNLPRNPVGLPVEGRPRQADAVTVREILTQMRTAKMFRT